MRFARAWLVTALTAGLGLACNGSGQDQAQDEEQARIAAGRDLFQSYCASCHGVDARGGGPVASQLRVPPADLTRIAARRNGRFEASEVAAYIDGRSEVLAHGRREMPVWGRVYDERNDRILADETLLSPGMIFTITAYLRSVQGTAGEVR
jgi:mono/diheme cytochrome c family protein